MTWYYLSHWSAFVPSRSETAPMKRWLFAAIFGLAGLFGTAIFAADKPKDAALERTRKQTQALDDLYKTAIVLVTENYVKSESDLAAGTAFKLLFEAMKK